MGLHDLEVCIKATIYDYYCAGIQDVVRVKLKHSHLYLLDFVLHQNMNCIKFNQNQNPLYWLSMLTHTGNFNEGLSIWKCL